MVRDSKQMVIAMRKSKQKRLTASTFEALSDAEKDRVYEDLDSRAFRIFEVAKPLTTRQKTRLSLAKKRMGRPKLGSQGAAAVTVTVEKALLKRADAYAKSKGMKRSELFAISVAEKIGRMPH